MTSVALGRSAAGPRTFLRPHVLLLGALTLATIAYLTILQIVEGPESLVAPGQVVLVAAFLGLVATDARAGLALAILELTVAGAGGYWTTFPGGLAGRVAIDAIVIARAALDVAPAWLRGHLRLGSYAVHALALLAIPVVWSLVGLANGNTPHDVFSDANGLLAFAFVVPVVALLRRGEGAWLRDWLFVACAIDAVVVCAIVAGTALGLLDIDTTLPRILDQRIDLAWGIGHMANGAPRLFLASIIYLVLGLALTARRLLLNPRRLWLWILWALLWIGIVASYTRGLWLGAVLASGIVLVLGSTSLRRSALVAGVTLVGFAAAALSLTAADFSLVDYLTGRVVSLGRIQMGAPGVALPAATALANAGFEHGGGWQLRDGPPAGVRSGDVTAPMREGEHARRLTNRLGGQEDYLRQTVTLAPGTTWVVSAALHASGHLGPARDGRALVAWNLVDGTIHVAPLPGPATGWHRLTANVPIAGVATPVELRLYAPRGIAVWDDVRIADGRPSVPPSYEPVARTKVGSTSLADPGFEGGSGWSAGRDPGAAKVSVGTTTAASRFGRRSLRLQAGAGRRRPFVSQTLFLRPRRRLSVSAWVRPPEGAAGLPGLSVRDVEAGALYTAPVTPGRGWRRVEVSLPAAASSRIFQVRLAAAPGLTLWDGVRVLADGSAVPASRRPTRTRAAVQASEALRAPVEAPPGYLAQAGLEQQEVSTPGVEADQQRREQVRVLGKHIREHPLVGSGFGASAPDYSYGRTYAYELSYYNLAFKTGFLGLFLFLSFPLRLLWDAGRARLGRRGLPAGVSRQEASLVLAFVATILFVSTTNPYILSTFGLAPILFAVAWLDTTVGARRDRRRPSR